MESGDITEGKCESRLGWTRKPAFFFFGIKGRFAGELFVTIKKLVGSGKPEVSPVGNCGAGAPAFPLPASCGSSALGIVLLFSRWFWLLSWYSFV